MFCLILIFVQCHSANVCSSRHLVCDCGLVACNLLSAASFGLFYPSATAWSTCCDISAAAAAAARQESILRSIGECRSWTMFIGSCSHFEWCYHVGFIPHAFCAVQRRLKRKGSTTTLAMHGCRVDSLLISMLRHRRMHLMPQLQPYPQPSSLCSRLSRRSNTPTAPLPPPTHT